MRYYVDTEFNGNEGQLISIALVRQDGAEFYAVLDMYQMPVPWVAEHVMPILGGHKLRKPENPIDRVPRPEMSLPVSRAECKKSLRKFLEKDTGVVTFLGDWPEDGAHVLNLLLRDHGRRNPPASFRYINLELPGFNTADVSVVPHNALEDARVLREYVETGLRDGPDGPLTSGDLALLAGT